MSDEKPRKPYNHARLEPIRRFLRFLLKYIGFKILVKVDRVEGLENVPADGPAILMINHIAFVDPIFVLHTLPRNITPMAKAEVYTYPVVGFIPHLWHVIPVHREEVDRRAIQMALEVLRAGEIILVAPEGTRHPALDDAKVGVAYLASRSGAPVIPVAVDNTQGFPTLPFTRRWRGPGASVRFGKPFTYRKEYQHASKDELRRMTDEAMYILAALLPPERRGIYRNVQSATQETIEWV